MNKALVIDCNDTGTVQYVGSTNNADKRRAAHSANPASGIEGHYGISKTYNLLVIEGGWW